MTIAMKWKVTSFVWQLHSSVFIYLTVYCLLFLSWRVIFGRFSPLSPVCKCQIFCSWLLWCWIRFIAHLNRRTIAQNFEHNNLISLLAQKIKYLEYTIHKTKAVKFEIKDGKYKESRTQTQSFIFYLTCIFNSKPKCISSLHLMIPPKRLMAVNKKLSCAWLYISLFTYKLTSTDKRCAFRQKPTTDARYHRAEYMCKKICKQY